MILVAGLSPAWQHILRLAELRVGAVNRAKENVWCASGKPLNSALAASRLWQGHPKISLVTTMGGTVGEAMGRQLADEQIDISWIQTNTPTRICTTVLIPEGIATELVEETAPISAAELAQFRQTVLTQSKSAKLLVLTGSLPPGVSTKLFAEILEQTGMPAILDCRGESLIQALPYKPRLVKPNRAELAETVGRSLENEEDILASMRELCHRGAGWVLISNGGSPALLANGVESYRIFPAAVSAINPIGSGDCVTAGIAVGLARGLAMPAACQLGIAAGCFNAGSLLPARIEPNAVFELADRIKIERLD